MLPLLTERFAMVWDCFLEMSPLLRERFAMVWDYVLEMLPSIQITLTTAVPVDPKAGN